MKIECITDNNDFAAIRDEWHETLMKSVSDNVCLSHEWMHTWWTVFGGENGLFILLCRETDTGELLGIFPGYVKTSGAMMKVRSVRFLGTEYVTSDFLEFIAVKGREQDVYAAFFSYLNENQDGWDALELTDVEENSPFSSYLKENAPEGRCSVLDQEKICPYVPLPATWKEYTDTLSAKIRKNIRYFRNMLAREGVVEVEVINDAEGLNNAMPDMIRLHQDRKVHTGLSGRFVSDDYTRFHNEICSKFLKLGWLMLVFLKVDGKRVAFYYNFRFRGKISAYQSGLDMEWSRFSVGAVLMGHLIEMSISDGYTCVDFLRGHERFKYHWTDKDRRLLDFEIYNSTARGNLAGVATSALRSTKSGLKKVLPEEVTGAARRMLDSFAGKK